MTDKALSLVRLCSKKKTYEEGCYTGEDVEDVKQKWEAKKHYFEQYKKDGSRPPCIELDTSMHGLSHRGVSPSVMLTLPKTVKTNWPIGPKSGMFSLLTL